MSCSALTLPQQRRRTRSDRGNVLPFTLVFVTLTSFIVMALLAFSVALFQNRPPLEERSDSLEAVRSATRMAIAMQRSHGPEGCYQSSTGQFEINDRPVTVSCRVVSTLDDTGGRYGLISTSADGNSGRNDSGIAGSGTPKTIRGSIFVNGGNLGDDAAAIEMIGGDLSAKAPTAYETDDFRYTPLALTTDIDLTAAATCQSLYGPNVTSTVFAGGDFGTAQGEVLAERSVVPLLTVDVTRATGTTELLGVIVSDSAGDVVLDRDRRTNHSFVVASKNLIASVDQVEVCSQPADTSSPTYIPQDLTFCGSPLINPELFSQAAGEELACADLDWWDVAGWKANNSTPYSYPMLPQIPTYQRSSSPAQVGSSNCFVFYPGRYQDALDLTAGNEYYFASGIYLFGNEVVMRDGARVVGGEGNWDGCTFDAEASFLPGSPRNHEITGKGVTFLFGSANSGSTNGVLRIDDASVRLNNRIATTSTRASSGISIMTVNNASASGVDPVIPANDQVLLPGCLQSEVATNPACGEDISSYTITPLQGGSSLSYDASTLTKNDVVLDVTLDGNSLDNNRFLLAGAVFTPNAAVDIRRTNSSNADQYQVVLAGGVAASTIEYDFAAGDAFQFFVGEESASVYQQVQLEATTTFDGRQFVSTVELEVDNAERYAINSWTVGADQSGGASGSGTTTASTGTTDSTGGSTPTTVATDAPGSSADPFVCLAEVPSTADGRLWFDFGAGPFEASVDSDEGGAWVMILQYHHAAGTNPFTQAIGAGSNWPVESTSSLGSSGSGTTGWGHTGQAAAASIPDSRNDLELRWFGATSNHSRVIHFRSPVLGQFQSNGDTAFNDGGISTNFTALTGHSSNLPASANNGFTSQGDATLTEFPMYRGANDHWGIRGRDYRWAMDDFTNGSGSDTVHKMWVRSNGSATSCASAPTTTTSTTTTSTTTTTTTTVPPNTTTTTTTVAPGYDYCGSLSSSYTYGDWGPGSWTAEHFRNKDLSGSPHATVSVSEIDVDYGWGTNATVGRSNDFSIRWTRTINVASTCDVRFRGGGDDGFRLLIDGSEILGKWWEHDYQTESEDFTLTPGEHTLVFEFYEDEGSAEATLEWRAQN